MKKTLLEITTEILSSIDGDEVNSIVDTTESLQVAQIVQNTYWDIISTKNLPKMFTFFELDPSLNVSEPNIMYMPSDHISLSVLRYDQATLADPIRNFQIIQFLHPSDFLQRMYSLDEADHNVVMFEKTLDNGDTITVKCRNDSPPKWYTTFDDKTLLFDSYDSAMDSTLQADKSLAYGEKTPVWVHEDSFIPDLPEKQFTMLRNEAKATAHAELRQAQNVNAERKARRAWITSQKTAQKVNNPGYTLDGTPNYGR